jgi:hypothetical protein
MQHQHKNKPVQHMVFSNNLAGHRQLKGLWQGGERQAQGNLCAKRV